MVRFLEKMGNNGILSDNKVFKAYFNLQRLQILDKNTENASKTKKNTLKLAKRLENSN